jgi:hypothetical protein
MGEFSATVETLLAGKSINAALLITITFADAQVSRLWTGFGDVVVGGNTYKGAGRLVSVDGLAPIGGTVAPTLTLRLAGVDATIAALAIAEKDLVPGADIAIAIQVFGRSPSDEWQPIDSPVQLGHWQGDQLAFNASVAQYQIELTGVSYFATRMISPTGYYSDRDQQRRYASDRGCEFMPQLADLTIRWPFGDSGA